MRRRSKKHTDMAKEARPSLKRHHPPDSERLALTNPSLLTFPQGVRIYSVGLARDEYGLPGARRSFPGVPIVPIPAFLKTEVVIQELLELGIAAKQAKRTKYPPTTPPTHSSHMPKTPFIS